MSADGCGMQHLYEVGHLALGQVIGDGVVPGVGNTLPVNAEHAGGQSIQLAWTGLDVIFCVVLSPTKCTCEAAFIIHILSHLLEFFTGLLNSATLFFLNNSLYLLDNKMGFPLHKTVSQVTS